MRTKLFSLIAALLFSQLLMAQFHLGFKAGTNITKVDGQAFKDKFRYGYHLGGFAEIGLGKKFQLQPILCPMILPCMTRRNYHRLIRPIRPVWTVSLLHINLLFFLPITNHVPSDDTISYWDLIWKYIYMRKIPLSLRSIFNFRHLPKTQPISKILFAENMRMKLSLNPDNCYWSRPPSMNFTILNPILKDWICKSLACHPVRDYFFCVFPFYFLSVWYPHNPLKTQQQKQKKAGRMP